MTKETLAVLTKQKDTMLIKELYKVDNRYKEGGLDVFEISILPSCDVYRGHFPGEPITPGVCSMQIIKECAQTMLNRDVMISEVRSCKYFRLISPELLPKAVVRIELTEDVDNAWKLSATISDKDGVQYVLLKATLI